MKRVFSIVSCLVLAATAAAQESPQWRGPNRDGLATGFVPPKQWPEKLTVRWKVTVGVGHSSPVLSAGRIFVFTRLKELETVSCLDAESGRVVWRQAYAAPYTMNSAATAHGKGPKSTPVVHDGKVCTLGISGILSCFAAADGKLLWRREFSRQFRNTSPLYGTAMSPLVYRGRLIAHVGGHGGGALTAFDLDTGKEEWSWAGDGPGYASPIIVELGGKTHLVTQTESKIIGVDPNNGALLWEMPFTTPWVQNIVTPAAQGDVVILSGLSNPTMAVRIDGRGGKWTAERVWENREASMYMNSPVLVKDLMFGFTNRNKGQLFCLDPKSGEIYWKGPPRSGDNAAILAAGDLLFLLTNDAELTVARASGQDFEVIRKYRVADSPTWAHPALFNHGVLIKDSANLTFWGW